MHITSVTTPVDLRAFIDLPYRLYQHDPNWVAPLRSEQAAQFDLRKNPMLEHCTYRLFLARLGVKPLRRYRIYQKEI